MFLQFLQLQIKAFFRSATMKTNLAIKIFLGLGILLYSVSILILGFGAYYGLEEIGLDPFLTINKYIIYWWIFDLVFRYFFQKAPVMSVRPFLIHPIKRRTITRYLLMRSGLSFFNIYPAFFFLPFSFALIINGYDPIGVLLWHLSIIFLTYFNNYLNLLVNNKNNIFISVAIVVATLAGLQYFQILDITIYTQPLFSRFYNFATYLLIPAAMLFGIYKYCFSYYKKSIYLDDIIQEKIKKRDTFSYDWLNKYGVLGTFLKNDIRLIIRNKRAKNTLMMSAIFLLYGLLIYTNDIYSQSSFWLVFTGIFIPGGFLFNFGGLVPSWDSAHYPFMMTQNIRYREYLASKWWLIVIATFISILLCAFYLFFGLKYYLAILAGGLFNIGVNSHLTLWAGAYVKTPIDLESSKKPFGDKSSFNAKTLLLMLPKLLIPFIIFYPFYFLFDTTTGLIAVALFGLLGLLFRNKVFTIIEKTYKKEKYDTILAYKEKN